MSGVTSLSDLAAKFTYLKSYLGELTKKGIPMPTFHAKLRNELRYIKEINVIYPIDEGEGIFAHVYRLSPQELTMYIIIQPRVEEVSDASVVAIVEELIAKVLDNAAMYSTREEMAKRLEEALEKVVEVNNSVKGNGGYRVKRRGGSVAKVVMAEEVFRAVKHTLIMEKVYLGALEPLLRDPYIEDISCDGVGPVYIYHKIFGSCRTNIEFNDVNKLMKFVAKLAERAGRPVNLRRPIVDASLPDGSRINIVYSPDVSLKGPSFTIRKFSKVPISIVQIMKSNGVSALEVAYLWLLLEHNMSFWVCGETASGKTTLLNALIPFIRFDYKIVTIEDTPELYVPHENWVREVTREGEGSERVTLFDLLKAALRQRPNYIIVGEIRGAEAFVAFQAIQTGHPVLATFHAGSVEKLVQRLTSDPINIPKTFIDNLNAAVITSAVRVPRTGAVERRVLSVNEIIGYDPVEGRLNYISVFEWDPLTDEHVFRGVGTSYLLEEKIALIRGLGGRMVKRIYDELELRAKFLEALAKAAVVDYFDVWRSIKYAQVVGVERAFEELMKGVEVWRGS